MKTPKNHTHKFVEKDNYLVCEACGKKKLNLKHAEEDNLLLGKKKDGKNYSVRESRKRYFFPDEWEKFINSIKDKKHKFFFITLLHTGARAMEALHIKYEDIDLKRETITIKVTKTRAAKRNYKAAGSVRTFFVASNYIKEYKRFVRGKKINPRHYIFLDNSKLIINYDELPNKSKSKYYNSKKVSYYLIMKRTLKKIGIKDWYNFSLHNIRKTYGNWMRIFNINVSEMCYRLGHDINTYQLHYGSSLIFTPDERRKIENILGDVK